MHDRSKYPNFIPQLRDILNFTKKPFIIENVVNAPLIDPVMLCGTMFGNKVFRHRLFETNWGLKQPHHPSHKGKQIGKDGFCSPCGHGIGGSQYTPELAIYNRKRTWEIAMGIDWMTKQELTQAIPPTYTLFIGQEFIRMFYGR